MEDLLRVAVYAYTKARQIHPAELAAEIGMPEETMVRVLQGEDIAQDDKDRLTHILRLQG